jgi:tetratricopeptide (TPR) repeat protein
MENGEFEVLLEVGQNYLLNQEYEKAIVKFSEAIKMNPHEPEAYYYLGLAYEGNGKFKEALEMYQKTIRLDQGYANAEIRINALRSKLGIDPSPA